MAPQTTNGNWTDLAEQASKEMDPARLLALVARLCTALDEGHAQRLSSQRHSGNGHSASV